jgi:predicted O-methyltransferase YrrM
MNRITEVILQKRVVVDLEGKEYPLHSETSTAQGEFLKELISEIDAKVCLEIGLAYGISALFIAEAIFENNASRLISIDPFQQEWHDIGLLNLKRAGYSRVVEFYREQSHDVLPRLLAAGERIDFAYVDTSKVFDVVLVDAYYLTRLLRVGGLLVLDDCDWPGVKRTARYIAKWPHLEISHRHNVYKASLKRQILSQLIQVVPYKEKLFSDSVLRLDQKLGTNARCVAFRKVAEDSRHWDWDCSF